jgi:hypothetical protein
MHQLIMTFLLGGLLATGTSQHRWGAWRSTGHDRSMTPATKSAEALEDAEREADALMTAHP